MNSTVHENNEVTEKITDLIAGLQEELEKNQRQMAALWKAVTAQKAGVETGPAPEPQTEGMEQPEDSQENPSAKAADQPQATAPDDENESLLGGVFRSEGAETDDLAFEVDCDCITTDEWQTLLALAGVGMAGYLAYRLWR